MTYSKLWILKEEPYNYFKIWVQHFMLLTTTNFRIYWIAHLGDFHLYADDAQLYISFKPGDSESRQTIISPAQTCIKDFKTWMTYNKLKLNDDKTEFIIFTTN